MEDAIERDYTKINNELENDWNNYMDRVKKKLSISKNRR